MALRRFINQLCEDDIGDSCNAFDEPCCFPLQCVNGRCAQGLLCGTVGTACTFGLNQCCTIQNLACQVNPALGRTFCLPCVGVFQPCNPGVPPGFLGSCCTGNACIGNICRPNIGK